jgi:hypothetical protein
MRVKLPDRGSNLQSETYGIQYAWWTHTGANDVSIHPPYKPNVDVRWAELDFIEHSGIQDRYTHNYMFAYTGEIIGEQYPWRYQNQIKFDRIDGPNSIIQGSPSCEEYADFRTQADPLTPADADGFHTLSCEVTPQRITWYMDGIYLQSTSGDTDVEETLGDIPLWNMEIFNQAKEGFEADYMPLVPDVPSTTTLFPYVSEMDFVRYYKFNCRDGVNRDEFINGGPFVNTDISDSVYGRIRLGLGTGSVPRIQKGEDVTMRAAEYVELLPGFEVEIGGQFYADVHECGL